MKPFARKTGFIATVAEIAETTINTDVKLTKQQIKAVESLPWVESVTLRSSRSGSEFRLAFRMSNTRTGKEYLPNDLDTLNSIERLVAEALGLESYRDQFEN